MKSLACRIGAQAETLLVCQFQSHNLPFMWTQKINLHQGILSTRHVISREHNTAKIYWRSQNSSLSVSEFFFRTCIELPYLASGCIPFEFFHLYEHPYFLVLWTEKSSDFFFARAVKSFPKREQDVTMNVRQDVTMDVYQLSAVLLAVYTVFAYCVFHTGKTCFSFKLIELLWVRLKETNQNLSLLILRRKRMQI